jgi:cellulose biosynthesis protein BcsQ
MGKNIMVISTHPGAGKTTITVNLAAGLVQKGYNVLIWVIGSNKLINKWLRIDTGTQSEPYIQKTHTGINVFGNNNNTPSFSLSEANKIFKNHDYLLMDINEDRPEYIKLTVELADYSIACTDLFPVDEPALLALLDNKLQKQSRKKLGINLIVPCKINAKEWDHNTTQLFNIAERMGYEKMADLIPHCEAIHDLPLDGKTVWELPGQYQNRKNAFDRLLERVEQDLQGL